MIGSLMYLTSSRPDLIYAVYLCARYQAKPTEKQLQAVKRIFQYLKGTINMGLWYSKDTVEEKGVIRTKKYAELSDAEKIQVDYDMKATNFILQGLPTDIYSLMNHHRVAKDLWERVKLLMQGTSLIKQERECKLYDAFDKFTHIKGESLHTYYLRFTQLINDMNIYKMKIGQFQVNTKFLNSLPPEWIIPQVAYQSPQDPTQLMIESPFGDSGFVVPVFSPGDNPIACLKKAMAFLTAVASSRFPSTNNQLRTSFNPRNQATIYNTPIFDI
ncbi:hypothetical protein Tco_0216313 [Tanacetum coccineum]